MCQLDGYTFSTVVGPNRAVEDLLMGWGRLDAAREAEIARPMMAELGRIHESLFDPEAPAVARFTHTDVAAGALDLLQAEVMLQHPELCIERGYPMAMASVVPPDAAGVWVDEAAVVLAACGSLPDPAAGPRMAVLDTGFHDVGGTTTMVDLASGQPVRRPAVDDHGHGTAVRRMIETVAAHEHRSADIESVRVAGRATTTSYEILCGLAYALYSEEFDIVNASLSAVLPGGCPTMLGTSMSYILAIARRRNRAVPVLVAAAGNSTSHHRFGYPARMSGAVVVQAWDSTGAPAPYNVEVPGNVRVAWACGGDSRVPLGRIGGAHLFGTSFAAAVVTGRLVR